MLLLSLCACIILCTGHVLGNKAAGPFQTMWLWYAYRIDGMSDNPEMALGCSDSTPGNRRCHFDEFLRYTESVKIDKGNPVPWTGSTRVGDNADPDVERTADELDKMGNGEDGQVQDPQKRYNNTPNIEKLFPGWLDTHDGIKNFENVHTKIMNVVQKVRQEKGDEHIARQLDAAKEAWVGIRSQRMADHATETVKAFKKQISNRMKIAEKDVPTRMVTKAGVSIEEVDTQELARQNPESAQKKAAFIRDFVNNYDAGQIKTPKNSAKQHVAAIQATQFLESRLNGPPTC